MIESRPQFFFFGFARNVFCKKNLKLSLMGGLRRVQMSELCVGMGGLVEV
jgi:hypothetical protein